MWVRKFIAHIMLELSAFSFYSAQPLSRECTFSLSSPLLCGVRPHYFVKVYPPVCQSYRCSLTHTQTHSNGLWARRVCLLIYDINQFCHHGSMKDVRHLYKFTIVTFCLRGAINWFRCVCTHTCVSFCVLFGAVCNGWGVEWGSGWWWRST